MSTSAPRILLVEDDARIRSAVWAPDRTLLAVAQGRSVWLYRPDVGDRVQLYPPPPRADPSSEEADDTAEEEREPPFDEPRARAPRTDPARPGRDSGPSRPS